MKFYLAPMEGLTGYVYRNVFAELFGGVDKYFTPFITPTQKRVLKTREKKDVAVENNAHLNVVPQILTNNAQHFIDTAEYLANLGYEEVNLNLGCPSATVVTKCKGSGFLTDLKRLDEFFAQICEEVKNVKISVKTRLGVELESEFEDILKVYNKYDFSELIVHPRLTKDYYKGAIRMDAFDYAIANSRNTICFNGDIIDVAGFNQLCERYPLLDSVMIGRGLLANPALIREIKGGAQLTHEEFRNYHECLIEKYMQELKSEADTLYKMKELWFYFSYTFAGKCVVDLKGIKKAKTVKELSLAAEKIWDRD